MLNRLKQHFPIILLYALFGLVLSINGVGVLENPAGFFSALGILLAVDILSFKRGLES